MSNPYGSGYSRLRNAGRIARYAAKGAAGYAAAQVGRAAVQAGIRSAARAMLGSRPSRKPAVSKRRVARKYTRKPKGKVSIQKQVSELKRQVSTQMGTYTRKYRQYWPVSIASTNNVAYNTVSFNSNTILSGVIDAVKYFNPSAPGTLVSVDLTAPTYQQQVRFTKSFGKIYVRNNYSVPCRVTLYVLVAKTDTSIVPETTMINSCTDQTNTTYASPLIFPSDCHEFNDLWKIQKSKTSLLEAGSELNLSHAFPAFNFDPALDDDQTYAYQRRYHGSALMVRVEGVVAHGSTSGVTFSKGGVDVVYDIFHTVKYPAGVNVSYLEVLDSPGAITGTLQLSQLNHQQATYAL